MRAFLREAPADASMTLKLADVTAVQLYPDRLRQEAARLARLLQAGFELRAVYLFGSLAWGDELMVEGDIDLAVEGLPPALFHDAVGCIERATTFEVDLVDLNSLPAPLQVRIRDEGRKL